MDQLFNVQILERAGLAAVALASIWANYKLVSGFNKTINNHVNHEIESNVKLTNAITGLVRFLEKKFR